MPMPTLVDPVKLILLMPECSTMACPATVPFPVIMLSTPSGRPVSCVIKGSHHLLWHHFLRKQDKAPAFVFQPRCPPPGWTRHGA